MSVIYWSGHGSYDTTSGMSYLAVSDGKYYSDQLSAAELRNMTASIKGRVVFLLDCCHSGGTVAKAPASGGSFGEDFCKSFGETLNRRPAMFKGENDLTGNNKYKVLAAAAYQQVSWQYGDTDNPSTKDIGGAFTSSVDRGLGYCQWDDNYNTFAADTDGDGAVTLRELYRWVSRENTSSVTRCYPEYDDMVIATYDKTRHPVNAISASASPNVLPVYQSASLTLNYTTTAQVPVYCEGLFSAEYFGLGFLEPTRSVSEYPEYYDWLNGAEGICAGSYKECVKLPAGVAGSSGTYEGEVNLTFDTSEIKQGIYYIRLLPEGGAAAYFPVMIVPDVTGTFEDDLTRNIISDPDEFSAELSTDDYTVTAENRNELRVRVTFDIEDWYDDEFNGNTNPNQYSSGVLLTCRITDNTGEIVRTLASNEIARYVYDSINYDYLVFNSHNDFYWDGKDRNGDFVVSGDYKVAVYADYYSCEDGTLTKIAKALSEPLPVTVTTPNTEKSDVITNGSTVIETVYKDDGTVKVAFTKGDAAGDTYVYVAAYARSGRMLAVKSLVFSADGFNTLQMPDSTEMDSYRVFALAENSPDRLLAYK